MEKPVILPTDILVRVRACGICGSDLHSYKLELFPEISMEVPQGRIPGHEFGGDVVEVGREVAGIVVGDRVSALTMGAMAEYVAVSPAFLNLNVYRLPPEVSYEEAATLEPLSTSLHAARVGKPVDGETAVVFGAGIIGLGVIQCLKALDIKFARIISVDMSDSRLEVAKELGADAGINAGKEDVQERITELAGTVPFLLMPDRSAPAVDIAYDCVGYVMEHPGTPAFEHALNAVREAGRVVVAGAFEEPVKVDLMPLMGKQLQVFGSLGYMPDDVIEALELIRSKKVDRMRLITHEFPIDQTMEGFETQLNAAESVKVLIKP
ncbi:zinc-binding dehydrogenase [Thermodesulfobacteriota bacterium]